MLRTINNSPSNVEHGWHSRKTESSRWRGCSTVLTKRFVATGIDILGTHKASNDERTRLGAGVKFVRYS